MFDVGTSSGCSELASYLTAEGHSGKLYYTLCIAGGMLPAGLISSSAVEANLGCVVTDKIAPMLFMARSLLPIASSDPGAVFSVMTGALGENAIAVNMPGQALTSMGNAALFTFTALLRGEQAAGGKGGPRILEVRLGAMVGDKFGPNAAPPSAFAKALLTMLGDGGDGGDGVLRITREQMIVG